MEKIKSFKDVEHLVLMVMVNPKKPFYQKHWELMIDQECEDNPTTDLINKVIKKGGKKFERELVHFLEHFYEEYVVKKIKPGELTMYHGIRQVTALCIFDGKAQMHYQNLVENNYDIVNYPHEHDDLRIENDGHFDIKGKSYIDPFKYLTDEGRKYCDSAMYSDYVYWLDELKKLFNKYLQDKPTKIKTK